MRASVGVLEIERFRAAVARRFGLSFDESKGGFLGEVLERRTEATRTSPSTYLDRLDSQDSLAGEVRVLAQELTVSETYFFRHLDQFRAFAEIALPDRLAARTGSLPLSLLSAGCASGEEAASLAILTREKLPESGCRVSIRAVDVNPASLEKARKGRYSGWSMRETPHDARRRWFRADGREFVLDEEIRGSVQFEERNFVHDNGDLWQAGAYDVVFCRNVLMYLTPDHAQALVTRITRSLAPGGYLFLGHAETLRGVSQDYHLRHTHGTFYYQRKDNIEQGAVEAAPFSSCREPTGTPLPDVGWAATWVETVQRASKRIEALAKAPLDPTEDIVGSLAASAPRPDLAIVLGLLKEERYLEALEVLGTLPSEFARTADALLLRAVLMTHSGELDASEQVCRELLAIDELNAGAHYLLALCREGVRDRQGAIDHDQVAAYLDPEFAMPRLHLGLLARRAGDHLVARRELGQALILLQREDVSRLLLFGGGFNRETLVKLCRAELAMSGGKA
jgi:chemotaxis protein methyltransferase CheR